MLSTGSSVRFGERLAVLPTASPGRSLDLARAPVWGNESFCGAPQHYQRTRPLAQWAFAYCRVPCFAQGGKGSFHSCGDTCRARLGCLCFYTR